MKKGKPKTTGKKMRKQNEKQQKWKSKNMEETFGLTSLRGCKMFIISGCLTEVPESHLASTAQWVPAWKRPWHITISWHAMHSGRTSALEGI